MVILVFILIAGISLVVLGGFIKRRFYSFGCLVIGSIMIAYSVTCIVIAIDNSKNMERFNTLHISEWPNKIE